MTRMMLAVALLAGSCGPAERSPPSDADVQESIANTAWVVTHVGAQPVVHQPEPCRVTLVFRDDYQFGGQGVINNYGARYRIVDGLIVADGIEQNLVGSDAETTAREEALFRALGRPFALKSGPAGTVLVDAAGQTKLRLRRSQGEHCVHIR